MTREQLQSAGYINVRTMARRNKLSNGGCFQSGSCPKLSIDRVPRTVGSRAENAGILRDHFNAGSRARKPTARLAAAEALAHERRQQAG